MERSLSLDQTNDPRQLRAALGLDGGVHGTKRKPGRPAKPKVPLPGTEAPSTLPTFVTDTDLTGTLENPLPPSSSVSDTSPSLVPSMVWDLTPIGYVESGSPRITDEQWGSLPVVWQERLQQLAADRAEDPRDTVAILAEYYSDTDLADEDLTTCIEFYLANELI